MYKARGMYSSLQELPNSVGFLCSFGVTIHSALCLIRSELLDSFGIMSQVSSELPYLIRWDLIVTSDVTQKKKMDFYVTYSQR